MFLLWALPSLDKSLTIGLDRELSPPISTCRSCFTITVLTSFGINTELHKLQEVKQKNFFFFM